MENMELIATIIVLIVVVQIYMLVENTRIVEVARAGKVDKSTNRYRLQRIENNNEKTKSLSVFAVCGESMKDFDIYDGNVIYVKPFKDEVEKRAINTYPVLMFSISGIRKFESRYKLRKFVSYVNGVQETDWGRFYDEHKDRLTKIERDDFADMCTRKVDSLKECGKLIGDDTLYILSETYEGRYLYSLHPIGSLYGKVCYVI